jgi:hypothetical protein
MTKKELKDIILKTLEKEGGAAGLKALAKAAKTSKNKLKKDLDDMSGVKQHQDGDYISTPIDEVQMATSKCDNDSDCRGTAICVNGFCLENPNPDIPRDARLYNKKITRLREVKEIIETMLDEKKKKKKDRCHRKADQVYGTKTSAYKSGAIVKCRKGMIWKKKK